MRLLIAVVFLCAGMAQAGVIHQYAFQVGSSVGHFTYDDLGLKNTRSLGHAFKTFDFSWNGHSFDASTVRFGSIWLDSEGKIDHTLNSTFWGSQCRVGVCDLVGADTSSWMAEIRNFSLGGFGTEIFGYGTGNLTAAQNMRVTYKGTVPEPGTIALLLGLLAMLQLHRRQKTLPLLWRSTG